MVHRTTGRAQIHPTGAKFLLSLLTTITLVFLRPFPATTETVFGPPLSIQELTRRAKIVIIGTVADIGSEWDKSKSVIMTRVQVLAEESLKGLTQPVDRVEFFQLGGKVGEITSVVGGAPFYREGERLLLFLTRHEDGTLRVIGQFQGKFDVELDPVSGAEMALRRLPGSDKVFDRMPLDQARSEVLKVRGQEG
ncbi:MAG: hypothetical protein HY695_09940 [Deltaproteobacteria bacterium]|nr:hypothetical protein [Deltaproteobacteria bacterium]